MLIHLSNVFLDKIFPSSNNRLLGKQRRERLKKILEDIAEASIRRKADAILVAGNLLDERWITDDTVKWLINLFESLKPVKVFIAPGEADCLCEESVYLYQTFPENVFIFTRPNWEVITDNELSLCVVGYGKHREGGYPEALPTLSLSRDTNNVCLVHNLDFDVEEVFSKSNGLFSYVALGNTLAEQKKELPNGVMVCSSGATEQFDFSQDGTPGFYCVHFELRDGIWKASNIERLSTKGTTYREIKIDCSEFTDAGNLLHEVELLIREVPAPRIIKLKLEGNISLSVFDNVLLNIKEIAKECDDFSVEINVNFVEVLEKSGVKLPLLVNEFYNIATQEIKYAPSEKISQIIRRATYLVLSVQEGTRTMLPFGIGE